MSEVKIDNLKELWTAGAVNLPQVAIQFSEAASSVHKTASSEGLAFDGATSTITSAWSRLRNMVQDQILVKSHEKCVNSGTALANFAIDISNQDTQNEQDLQPIIKAIENSPVPDNRPPPYVPDAPSSGDPHPSETSQAQPGELR